MGPKSLLVKTGPDISWEGYTGSTVISTVA